MAHINSDNSPEKHPLSALHEDIAAAISGMIYISESDAPLELMEWAGGADLSSLQHKIEEQMQLPPAEQTIITAEHFLASIHYMDDPADPLMVQYVNQYDVLFDLLRERSKEVVVIRGGNVEVHVFIAAFGGDEPVIIHTIAIQT